MSMMVSFVLSFFPRDVLDEILNLIESVSEDFPSYSSSFSVMLLQSHLSREGAAGILSTPTDIPFFSDATAIPTAS